MLLAIQGNQAVIYVYELIDGKQKVTHTKFTKGEAVPEFSEEKKDVVEEPKEVNETNEDNE